jgi:ornithine cyclodeaminase/alanine dehydrogenase-like protein (mu-crystallin family)
MPPPFWDAPTSLSSLTVDACLVAVEAAFRAYVAGQPPAILGVPAANGGFHVKAARLVMSRPYFAAKMNANFPGNPARSGLPAIHGVVALFTLFDSTGTALQDVAAAVAVYERAVRLGRGETLDLGY